MGLEYEHKNGREVAVYSVTRGRLRGRRCETCGRRLKKAEDLSELLEDFHRGFSTMVREEAEAIWLATKRGEYTSDERFGLLQALRMMIQRNPRGNELGWKQYRDLKAEIDERRKREGRAGETPVY